MQDPAKLVNSTIPEYGILTQQEFLDEFAYRFQPGQHVMLFGPTGRGKTTMLGKLLSRTANKFEGLLTLQLGPDKALNHLGKPTDSWPPKAAVLSLMRMEARDRKKPIIRRYEPRPTKPEHFLSIHRTASTMLRWMFGREGWALAIPDLQVTTDPGMMGLGKEVDQLIITIRKLRSSMFMDGQAPRWIPRSASDQTTHLLIWRNRDEAVVKRLSEIMGLPLKFLLYLFQQMEYHDCLWIDNMSDQYFIVKGGNNA